MTTREDILSLADCPFCGLEPMLLETREVGGSAQQFMIACYQCGIEMGSEDHEDLVETWSSRAAPTPPAAEAPGQEPVALTYTNWRGETHTRRVLPLSIWYGKTEWHLDPQWFLRARDVERDVERDFALKDFGSASRTYSDTEAKGVGRAFFDGLVKGFITLTSGDGNPCIKIGYRTLKDAQDAHGLLIAAIRSLASPAPMLCEHCNGDGDVHTMDGEWVGYCVCDAGKAAEARPFASSAPKGET